MAWFVTLTVADHEQNGFVALARWNFPDEVAARAFILDLHDERGDTVDDSRNLPMQSVMRLAPVQVSEWLDERPDPDTRLFSPGWRGTLLPTPSLQPVT
jgi:hypothetical protein